MSSLVLSSACRGGPKTPCWLLHNMFQSCAGFQELRTSLPPNQPSLLSEARIRLRQSQGPTIVPHNTLPFRSARGPRSRSFSETVIGSAKFVPAGRALGKQVSGHTSVGVPLRRGNLRVSLPQPTRLPRIVTIAKHQPRPTRRLILRHDPRARERAGRRGR